MARVETGTVPITRLDDALDAIPGELIGWVFLGSCLRAGHARTSLGSSHPSHYACGCASYSYDCPTALKLACSNNVADYCIIHVSALKCICHGVEVVHGKGVLIVTCFCGAFSSNCSSIFQRSCFRTEEQYSCRYRTIYNPCPFVRPFIQSANKSPDTATRCLECIDPSSAYHIRYFE